MVDPRPLSARFRATLALALQSAEHHARACQAGALGARPRPWGSAALIACVAALAGSALAAMALVALGWALGPSFSPGLKPADGALVSMGLGWGALWLSLVTAPSQEARLALSRALARARERRAIERSVGVQRKANKAGSRRL